MQVIIDYIVQYAAIWGPAVTAIAGTIVIFIKAFKDIKESVKEVKDEQSFKELKAQLESNEVVMREQQKTLKLLLNKLAKIENYEEELDNEGQ